MKNSKIDWMLRQKILKNWAILVFRAFTYIIYEWNGADFTDLLFLTYLIETNAHKIYIYPIEHA